MIDISKYKVNELDIIVCKPYLHQLDVNVATCEKFNSIKKNPKVSKKRFKKLIEEINATS